MSSGDNGLDPSWIEDERRREELEKLRRENKELRQGVIKELQAEAHEIAISKGWWDGLDRADPYVLGAQLCQVHSEASEALECVRDGQMEVFFRKDKYGNNKPEGLPIELADVVLRVMDLCGALDIDLSEAIATKMAFNRTRTHRHGGRAL